MDSAVLAALAKWPNVPDVYGWLGLDRRGQWRIKGDPVSNPQVCAFIGRNYARTEEGAWFFQNGPQRVFVALDYTPWVLRLTGSGTLETHAGIAVTEPRQAWLDEDGNLLLLCEHGIGLVTDRDLPLLLDAIVDASNAHAGEESLLQLMAGAALPLQLRLAGKLLPLAPIRKAQVPGRFGFIANPGPAPGSAQNTSQHP